jgi:hypothetical protein
MNKEIKAKPVVFNDLPEPEASDSQVDTTDSETVTTNTPKKLPLGTIVPVDQLKRIYLKTVYKDGPICKKLKCTWDPSVGKWWCRPNNKLALSRYEKTDNKKVEGFIEEKDRVYIDVDFKEKDFASSNGAKWSVAMNSWYCHKNNEALLEIYQH